MAITSEEILALAASQTEQAKCEASYRNTIGRAYYAVYHKATDFHNSLSSPGRDPDRPTGAHKTLTEKLRRPTISDDTLVKKSKIISRLCRDLHLRRCRADYDLATAVNLTNANQALLQAEKVFSLINKT